MLLYICQNAQIDKKANPTRIVCPTFSFMFPPCCLILLFTDTLASFTVNHSESKIKHKNRHIHSCSGTEYGGLYEFFCCFTGQPADTCLTPVGNPAYIPYQAIAAFCGRTGFQTFKTSWYSPILSSTASYI